MESIYENVDYMPSATASDGNCSLYRDREREREATSPKWTKVLPIVLGFNLVFALGGFCALWILYSSLSIKLSAQETKSKLMAREFQELTVNYTRARERLTAKDNMVRELTDNYTRVRECLSTKDTMVRELEERMADYTRVREQLSFYKAFAAQSLNNMSLTAWGGKFYFFSSDKLNWTSSRDVCVSKGADLVTITSQSEQDFVVSNVSEMHWIGLNYLDTEGHWVWVNNQSLTETGVQFWHKREYGPREPDNWKQEDPSGENCASLGNQDGYFNKWFDQSCKEQKKFICEKN